MADPVVVEVNPFHPQVGRIVPFLLQRVIETSKAMNPETDSLTLARGVLGSLATQDRGCKILALLDDKANVVGHVLANASSDGVRRWVTISQYRADGNVGDALKNAIGQVEEWAKAIGANDVVLVSTGNQGDRWKDRGYKTTRTIQIKTIPPES